MTDKPPVPASLRGSGRKVWGQITADFHLEKVELLILLEICRTRSLMDDLQAVLDTEGVMGQSSQGVRVSPAAVELRQQRTTLTRLVASLNLPADEDDSATGG